MLFDIFTDPPNWPKILGLIPGGDTKGQNQICGPAVATPCD